MNTSVYHPKSMPLPIYIHMLAWAVFFAFPLLMSNTSEGIQWNKYLRHLIVLAMFFVIFYANYWVFVPKYLLKKESSRYLIYNIFLIFAVVSFLHLWYMPYLQDIVWGEHKPEPLGICCKRQYRVYLHGGIGYSDTFEHAMAKG